MFGFIKNFFGGIFGFFAGLLGLKKSEYFMDLGDSSAKESAKVEPATAKKAEPVALAATPAPEKVAPAKSATAQKAEPTKKAKKEKEPAASVPAKSSEPAKVAATNGKVLSQSEPILTFATHNLMPTPSVSRRGPGPNMNSFREMARQVKTK